jgi:phosphotransferase system IIB component
MIIETVTKIYEDEFNRFIGYKVTNSQNNQVTFVPNNEANSDYQAIQEWIAAGNTVIDNPPN